MAAIDSLLRVMTLRDAEAMTITTGQVPSLRRAGNAEPMAMPALDRALVAGFVDEIVPEDARAAFEERGSGEYTYQTSAGDTVAVLIEINGAGHRLVVRRQGRGAAAPAPRPSGAGEPVRAPNPALAAFAIPVAAPVAAPVAHAATAAVAPAVALPGYIAHLLSIAAERRASDLILSQDLAPRLRVDGDVAVLDEASPTTAAEILQLLAACDAPIGASGSVDFGATIDGHRLRGHGFRHERGVGVALRLIRRDVPTLDRLGLPSDLADLVKLRSGLVLVAGPTGSGKSTTLVALVAQLERTRAAHVVTLEDPIEYLHETERCLVHQREVGHHVASFADGLRAALREAPDVIVVGELRDRETIAVALSAAETGHLVLGTVHAPGAAVAVDRLIDAFPEHQQRQARTQIAAVLRTVVTQHLLPARRGGRIVALERVPVTSAVASLIRKNELHMLGTHIQTGRDAGMIPLEKSLARLVRSQQVDAAVARAVAADLDFFDASLRTA
ncbi:MAG TPA: PilT/PilU family type 4a pilus ATPase [Kofleriaceae bacterium]|nr:PilT/PilU family type 4a pilus ATPase [Kofleriaceae bacterium]